jgi:hypothetical protein
LKESAQNQQQLHELQQTLRKEQSVGQDAILAGTEVLQELARLKLQMSDNFVISCFVVLIIIFAERMRLMRRGSREAKLLLGGRRESQRAHCPYLRGDASLFIRELYACNYSDEQARFFEVSTAFITSNATALKTKISWPALADVCPLDLSLVSAVSFRFKPFPCKRATFPLCPKNLGGWKGVFSSA